MDESLRANYRNQFPMILRAFCEKPRVHSIKLGAAVKLSSPQQRNFTFDFCQQHTNISLTDLAQLLDGPSKIDNRANWKPSKRPFENADVHATKHRRADGIDILARARDTQRLTPRINLSCLESREVSRRRQSSTLKVHSAYSHVSPKHSASHISQQTRDTCIT